MLQALFLGLLQGITEFLPVSSSGHLVLFSEFINVNYGATFDVMVHAGTLLATIIYFFPSLKTLSLQQIKIILVASVPAGIVGYFLSSYIESIFSNPWIVVVGLLITSFLLLSTKNKGNSNKQVISYKSAIIIGLVQALAITPGISRSGSTISAAINQGVDKKQSFNFSFLLSMPAIAGAVFLSLRDVTWSHDKASLYLIGLASASISGYISLKLLKKSLDNANFYKFAYYTIMLSLISVLILI